MCGIAGLYFGSGEVRCPPDHGQSLVEDMAATMAHRGPDDHGLWSDQTGLCHLAHRRLSIIDTSDAGRQPMLSDSGRWVISFNGEIYNFQEIRPHLESAGVTLRGRTDTEVLLESLALWGRDALPKLDGMFAFAAFDHDSRELLLARDAFGEKPLYYMELHGGGLAFASELQALEALPWFDSEVSIDAVGELLMFQYVGAPRSIYRKVKKLEPGCWLRATPEGRIEQGRYFEFKPGQNGLCDRPLDQLVDELEEILTRSIRRRLISDVPLGAFLSGGVDSSTVCAIVHQKLGRPLNTFSIGFSGTPDSEHEAARMFARHLGTQHHDQVLTPHASDFLLGIGALLDEPNADSSCMPTFLLSAYARQFVTVALSGDGGDEMFCGYGRHFATLDESARKQQGTLPQWQAGSAYYANRILVSEEAHLQELLGFVPPELQAHLTRLRGELDQDGVPLVARLRKTDTDNYLPGAVLPKVDRMSMRHSLEVRTPFLNVELARFAERLPPHALYAHGRGKIVLRELASRYLPREWIDAPKKGFGIPMTAWGRDELLSVCSKLLASDDSRLRQSFGADAIDRFMLRQRSAGGFSTYQVWALAMLESWVRHHPAKLPDIAGDAASRPDQHISVPAPMGAHATPSPPLPRIGLRRQLRTQRDRLRRLFNDLYGLFVTPQLPMDPCLLASNVAPGCLLLMEQHELRAVQTLDEQDAMQFAYRIRRIIDQLHAINAIEPGNVLWPGEKLSLRDEAFSPLPGWDEPLPAFGGSRPLAGACLLFLGENIGASLEYPVLERLRRMGARNLVFPHPERPHSTLTRLTLQKKSSFEEWQDLRQLRAQAIWLGWRAKEPTPPTEACRIFFAPNLTQVPPVPDTELCERFMLFEGPAQMPPIPSSHRDLETRGRGRYSVINQRCIFSRSTAVRCSSAEYWLVENRGHNRNFLPISPQRVELSRDDDDFNFAKKLEAFIAAHGQQAQPCQLQPGDRVMVITHGLPPGGAERQWCYLAIGLKNMGYEVSFVVADSLSQGENRHYQPLLEEDGLGVTEIGSVSLQDILNSLPEDGSIWSLIHSETNPFGIQLARLTHLLLKSRPKVVFAQLDIVNLMAAIAGHIAAVPRVVLSFRNYNPSHFSYLHSDGFLPLYQTLVKSPCTILSGNATEANNDYAQWIGIPETRVSLVPNAIDPRYLRRASPEEIRAVQVELGLVPMTPVILGVFRLSEEKNPMLFLQICESLLAQGFPKLRILIAGIGPLGRAMEERICSSGLERSFSFLGSRSDIPALLGCATLLLNTSSFEGMSNAIMEAQFLGVPVVATRTGATGDILSNGASGFVCEPQDYEGLQLACLKILSDPKLAARMGQTGATNAAANFSVGLLCERYISLINES